MIEEIYKSSVPDGLNRRYVFPKRIVWQSDGLINTEHAKKILKSNCMQPVYQNVDKCVFRCGDMPAGILLDFGCELNGGIRIVINDTFEHKPIRLRIRFGESVSEAMNNNGNDNDNTIHSVLDQVVEVPCLGAAEFGNTGFRFVRIDMLSKNTYMDVEQICAVFVFRDLEYKGKFECSDSRLNRIWKTGAYTVHLNMQEYLWDGIKRDRLVWLGDMHPEVMAINSVFGFNKVVPDSLDFIREKTPLPKWMNSIPSYSLWWILVQKEWYLYQGDFKYLEQQRDYLLGLVEQLLKYIDSENHETLPDMRFLDWPTSQDKDALNGGLQALMVLAFEASAWLCGHLGELVCKSQCQKTAAKLRKCRVFNTDKKQAVAMMSLANLIDAKIANSEILSRNQFYGLSTFFGYYVLQARSLANDYQGCLDVIRNYWGAMLDLGATTFWEDFDMTWKDSARIDEITPDGQRDFHVEYGDYCYKGLRHSLCHGWSSGPTAWLTEHILGFKPIEPGSKKILLKPELVDLDWAKGTFPTPYGLVTVSHKKDKQGKVQTDFEKPKEISVFEDKK